jgi:hypothetical protein
MASKKTKTQRDKMSDNVKTLTNLLLWEASGGMIPLPKGMEKYSPPPIPFTERRALIDSVNKQLLVDMKVDPVSEESGFELLKEELNEQRKRNSKVNGSGRNSSSSSHDGSSDDELFARGRGSADTSSDADAEDLV